VEKPKGRILPDLSKDTKMADATQVDGKRKIGERVRIEFYGADKKPAKSPPADVQGFRAVTPQAEGDAFDFKLEEVAPETILRLAAFGASVHARNAVNTTPKGEEEQGRENMVGRLAGFLQGAYRKAATGGVGATPLILDALERAFAEKGIAPEEIAAKVAQYNDAYYAGETDEEMKEARANVTRKLSAVPEIRKAMEDIRAERAAKRLGAIPSDGDIDSL
jgi:hypothetical protein